MKCTRELLEDSDRRLIKPERLREILKFSHDKESKSKGPSLSAK